MKDIVTIGEILIDLTYSSKTKDVPVYTANPGGAPANVAVVSSKMGLSSAFIGKVGNDFYGDFLKKTLKDNGVDISALKIDESANTTLAVVSVSDSGERSFAFYRKNCADTLLCKDDIDINLLKNTRFLHFGSVGLTNDPEREACIFAVEQAKSNGVTITYDPNYRASLWKNESEAVERMRSVLNMVDILKISDEELPLLAESNDIYEGSKIIAEKYGVKLVIITLGADGAFYRRNEETGIIPGRKVKVADTNGAGDTFFGAFLSHMVHLNINKAQELTPVQLEECIRFANIAASITTSRSGAIPAMPDFSEVEEVIRTGGI